MTAPAERRGFKSLLTAGSEATVTTVDPESLPPPAAAPAATVPSDDETRVFEPSNPSLHESLPRGCALLTVTEDHEQPGHFHLGFYLGDYQESRKADIRSQVPPRPLSAIAERGRWKDDHDELRNWWRELARLRGWMHHLVGQPGARLIVWDNTGFQTPWELYYVDKRLDGGGPHGWLGSLVEVIRWTSLMETGRETRYTAVAARATGGVVVMETDEVRHAGVAHMADRYRPPTLKGPRGPLRSIDALLAALDDPDLRFGLLLVHCHGINATNANEFRLAGRTLNEVELADMPALASTGAVVLLGACNTARIVPVGPDSTRATRSFAETFLRKGASTVIATLGQVDLDHAHEFVFQLLDAESGHRVSELLLAHRRRYADRLRKAPRGSEPYQAFFNSFMYVYFGNPETTLEITGAGGAG